MWSYWIVLRLVGWVSWVSWVVKIIHLKSRKLCKSLLNSTDLQRKETNSQKIHQFSSPFLFTTIFENYLGRLVIAVHKCGSSSSFLSTLFLLSSLASTNIPNHLLSSTTLFRFHLSSHHSRSLILYQLPDHPTILPPSLSIFHTQPATHSTNQHFPSTIHNSRW